MKPLFSTRTALYKTTTSDDKWVPIESLGSSCILCIYGDGQNAFSAARHMYIWKEDTSSEEQVVAVDKPLFHFTMDINDEDDSGVLITEIDIEKQFYSFEIKSEVYGFVLPEQVTIDSMVDALSPYALVIQNSLTSGGDSYFDDIMMNNEDQPDIVVNSNEDEIDDSVKQEELPLEQQQIEEEETPENESESEKVSEEVEKSVKSVKFADDLEVEQEQTEIPTPENVSFTIKQLMLDQAKYQIDLHEKQIEFHNKELLQWKNFLSTLESSL